MSFFHNLFKALFGGSDSQEPKDEIETKVENSKIFKMVSSKFFFARVGYENEKLISLVVDVKSDEIDNFAPTGELKTLDLFLTKNQPEIIQKMLEKEKVLSEEAQLIILKHMRNKDYRDCMPNFIQRVFGDSLLPFAYSKYLVQSAKKSMIEVADCLITKNYWGRHSPRDVATIKELAENNKPMPVNPNKFVLTSMQRLDEFMEIFSSWVKICQIINQFSDGFAKNFVMINFVEDFFSGVKKELAFLGYFYDFSDISVVMGSLDEKKKELLDSILKKSLSEVGLVSEVAGVDYGENQMYLMRVLQSHNVQNVPFKDFSNEVNTLFESILVKLNNVSVAYIKEDLSKEVERMFDDVLNNMLKHYFAIPVSYRKEMFNAEGKTVEMMLIEVLKVVNNRLQEIGQKSHEDSLREVSVMREFSKDRWEKSQEL